MLNVTKKKVFGMISKPYFKETPYLCIGLLKI